MKSEPNCSMWMDRQTDRHDEANSRFSKFCECTKIWSHDHMLLESVLLKAKILNCFLCLKKYYLIL